MKVLKKKRLLITLILIAFLLFIGYIYQKIGVLKDMQNYKPVGNLYTVDNKSMHIYTGGSGDYTIIFSAGWGTTNPYTDFYPLYNNISVIAKYAVYDKFGYGYSDYTDKKRDIDIMVNEIHDLLLKSGQKPPYIFVGHSLASLEVIRYAQTYKDEVKGIVLIDGGNPEFYAASKPVTLISRFQHQLIKFGVARLLFHFDAFTNSVNSERNKLMLLPEELKNLDQTSMLIKGNNKNITDEMKRSQENALKVVKGEKLGDTPLIIITSGDFGEAGKQWLTSQDALKNWSKNSKQFVVQSSRHYIHQYQPDVIIETIKEIIHFNTTNTFSE